MSGAQPIPNISSRTVTTILPSSGLRRGVIVLDHGLNGGTTTNSAPPYILQDSVSTVLPVLDDYYLTLANMFAADGWIVIQPPEIGDQYVSNQGNGIYNDIINDPGSGTRFLSELLTWWDYVVSYIYASYGDVPIVIFGMSWGAYHAVKIANMASNTVVAYGAHCLPTILANISSVYVGSAWASLGHGADILTTDLNGITIPGIVGYGTNDGAVGWDTAGTNGTPVSNTDSLITTAQSFNGSSSLPIRNTTTNNHGLLPSDSGQQLKSTPTATALSSMSTLTVQTTYNMTGSSGHMSIYASDNQWHTVTFTGHSTTTFTTCTYSGTTSATVINGSPICLSGNGPTNSMSYPYWFSTVIDPLYPKYF